MAKVVLDQDKCIGCGLCSYICPSKIEVREFVNIAKKYNILMVPGSSFAGPGYVRISYCVSHEQIVRSLPKFEALAKEFGL